MKSIQQDLSTQQKEEMFNLTYMINSKKCSNNAPLYYRKGILLKSKGKYQEAFQCFDQATKNDQNDAQSYYQKGFILRFDRKDSLSALIEFNEAIRLDPNYLESYNMKGYALNDLGRYEEAVNTWDQIPKIIQKTGITVPYYLKPIFPSKSFVEEVRRKGIKTQSNQKNSQKIQQICDQQIMNSPNNPHCYHSKGKALLELGKFKEAIKCFDKALTFQHDNCFFLYSKGIAIAKQGNKNQVQQFYNSLLKIKSKFVGKASTYLQKGIAMDILDDKQAAIANFDLAIQDSPDYHQAFIFKGKVLYKLGDYMKAMDCFNKALKINSKDISAFFCKSHIFMKLEQYTQSIKFLDQIIKIQPNNASAFNNKGWALAKMGDHNQALKYINKSLLINPNIANTHHSQGFALSGLGRQNQAIESFKKALSLDSKLVEAYSDKGKAYFLLKKYNSAIQCYDLALALDSNDSKALEGKCQAIKALKNNQLQSTGNISRTQDLTDYLSSKPQLLQKTKIMWYGEVKGEISKFKNFQELKISSKKYKNMFKYLKEKHFQFILSHMENSDSQILDNLDICYEKDLL